VDDDDDDVNGACYSKRVGKLAKLPCHDAFFFKELVPMELNLEVKYILLLLLY